MRLIVAVTAAVLFVGCSTTPTAPSLAGTSTADITTDRAAKPTDHTAGWRKVTLFFDGHGLDSGDRPHQVGNAHLVGLPVHLRGTDTSDPSSGVEYNLTTGRQATINADFPRSYNRLFVQWSDWDGWCGGTREIALPIRSGPGEEQPDWIVVTRGC